MNTCDMLNGFKFDNNFVVDNEVRCISTRQIHALVSNGYLNLSTKRYLSAVQFMTQTFLVRRFK